MNSHSPREFCQVTGYRSTLLLTWSFDAVFFERLVHHDLRHGGSGTQLVLADRAQVEAVAPTWSGRLQRLGRSFVLETANVSGNFHPKVILRLGDKGGAIWIGSGNVTPGGWGQQRELASQWKFGPEEDDNGAWVPSFLSQVKRWCKSTQSLDAISRMADESWIPHDQGPAFSESPLILSGSDLTLAAQLESRWQGREFTEVHLLTGSTDKTGAFLRWAHETFGIEKAVVCVAPSRSIFDPVKLEALPLEIEFVDPSDAGMLHAKYYWFEAGADSAAVIGSPNCSYSAWLNSPNKGGNIECALVYDAPERSEFESVMTDFAGDRRGPADHLLVREPDHNELNSESQPYSLVQAELDTAAATIRIRISPAPEERAIVAVILGNEAVALTPINDTLPGGFAGPVPEGSSLPGTVFTTARVSFNGESIDTRPRWVDQVHDLRSASADPRLTSLFQRFRTVQTSTEQNKLSRDVHVVMDVIFGDKAGFPDIPVGHGRLETSSAGKKEIRHLDPKDLVAELKIARDEGNLLAPASPGFTSLNGVMHALFPDEDEDHHDEDELDETSTSANRRPGAETTHAVPRGPAPPEKLRKKLAKQMETFLQRLQGPEFARTCSAPQMVQAAAFPLAMAVLGQESAWTDIETARRWVLTTATTLFHRIVTPGAEGLLDSVRARYAKEGREGSYDQAVGDGLLWATLGSILLRLGTQSTGASVERALMLRELDKRKDLVSSEASTRLGVLVRRIHHRQAFDALIDEMPLVVERLEELESFLLEQKDRLTVEQDGTGHSHLPGDPLWNHITGWVFADEEMEIHRARKLVVRAWLPAQFKGVTPVVGAGGFYVNLRVAAAMHPSWEPLRTLVAGSVSTLAEGEN